MNNIPYVIEQTSQGERSYDIFSRMLKDRIIMVEGEISSTMAAVITAQLLFLAAEDPEKDICMYINSPGGSVNAGLAIVDTMNYIKCDVSTICVGLAASMGSVILTSGCKGKRFALPHSEILIHQPLIGGGGLSGQCTDITIHADHLKKMRKDLETLIANASGQPLETVHDDCERDHYLSAAEAVDYGLIDAVVTSM